MKILIYSRGDPAGVNISSHLLFALPFKETFLGSLPAHLYNDFYLISTESPLVQLSIPIEGIEWALCLSKHKSESGIKCLTVHTPGNLSDHADLGGRPREVAISNPPLQQSLLKELHRTASELSLDIPVSVEATHHGPTSLPFPVTFVELGSDEAAWRDELLGKVVAKAVSQSLKSPLKIRPGAIGIGGGHYSDKFTHYILSEDALIGHIIPKYAMNEGMDPSMLSACIERTLGGCSRVYIDWKGTPSRFKDLVRSMEGIEVVRV
ncbi:MAG: D-aminoacyl-tRNA deacylase [Candidatus Methanomethylicaceae archaeon]